MIERLSGVQQGVTDGCKKFKVETGRRETMDGMSKLKRWSPKLLFLSLTVNLAACASSTIIPFQARDSSLATGKGKPTYPATQPDQIGVYRSTYPYKPFTELGLITFRTGSYDLPRIYAQLRRDSAPEGAQAGVDTKIKGESHWEQREIINCVPQTVCGATAVCNTQQVCTSTFIPEEVTTFLVEGSMIRREP